jgi:hypothetical protein
MANESPDWETSSRILVLTAFALVLAAWGAMAAGKERISKLDLSRWGSDIDVLEALQISEYKARYFRPYIWGAIGLDGLAFWLLCWAGRGGKVRSLDATVWIVWLLSAGWHGLNGLLI